MAEEEGGDINDYLTALTSENKDQQNKIQELNSIVSQSSFANDKDKNLIQFQLETEDILDKIEHFLRGEIIKTDDEGNIFYEKQKNEDLVILNDYGVNTYMQILGNYVNRNTNLSFYDEERINEILFELGDQLRIFNLCNYEKIGMTTSFKKSRSTLLVLNILHIIESSYRRAIGGKERDGINDTRIVTQTDNIGGIQRNPMPKKKFNLFNPKSW
jgi:hypothetical protein